MQQYTTKIDILRNSTFQEIYLEDLLLKESQFHKTFFLLLLPRNITGLKITFSSKEMSLNSFLFEINFPAPYPSKVYHWGDYRKTIEADNSKTFRSIKERYSQFFKKVYSRILFEFI